jgi:hypothetical protein
MWPWVRVLGAGWVVRVSTIVGRYLGGVEVPIEVAPQKRIQIPRLVHDVISMIDV